MSALTDFGEHARRLSTSDHRDDCEGIHRITRLVIGLLDTTLSCPKTGTHESHDWIDKKTGFDWCCPGLCGGCMPESERALWRGIADDIDAYVDEGPTLWGDE